MNDRAADAQQRFVRENDGALRDRVDVAGESQGPQIVEEGRIE